MSIIKAVDSEFAPSNASLSLAKADSVAGWNGYLPGLRIAHGWTQAEFAAVKGAGLSSLAYASGWEDAATMKALAASWGIRGCLDVESGIRGDGAWVQPWLVASGFGLYGNAPVHTGRTAAFHILAAYPGHDPAVSWPGVRPAAPCGWQWAGSTTKYAANVDLCWFDAGIYGTPMPPPYIPPAFKENHMTVFQTPTSGTWVMNGSLYSILETAEDVTVMLARAGQTQSVAISEAQHIKFKSNSAQPGAPS